MASYKVFARWDDAAQLRWDSGHCEIGERYIRFYLRHRKNAQDAENFVDIAKPRCSSEHGAYHILCDARNVFKSGHVLPYISAAGHVDTKRPLPYRKFVQHLRKCLVSAGVPQQEALRLCWTVRTGGRGHLRRSRRRRRARNMPPRGPTSKTACAPPGRSACDGFWGGDIMVLGSLKVSKCALL